jgi:U3 small nucleolar ribonucleoprotein protein IMP3
MSKLRNLKYHEQKLLKKVDFLSWESDGDPDFRKQILKSISMFKLKDQEEYFKFLQKFNNL